MLGESTRSNMDASAGPSQLYDYLSFVEMKNVVQLLMLYVQVNTQILQEETSSSKIFRKFTHSLQNFEDILSKTYIKADKHDINQLKQKQYAARILFDND